MSRNGDAGTGAWVKGGRLHTEAASQGPRGPGARPDGETETSSPSWAGPMLVSMPRPTGIGKDQGQAQGRSSGCRSRGVCWDSVCTRAWWGDQRRLGAPVAGLASPTAAPCGPRGAPGRQHTGRLMRAERDGPLCLHDPQRTPLMLGLSGTICRMGAKHALLHLPKHVFRLASHLRRALLNSPG
ncbi:unnamed protein product [Rangifer tarandus platyrhynchus]|uniref:Uncharacterized protein n=1 Tax=Rangifer tarandus platyrhynchus TaxID=3082113 RepID=A0ABN8YCK5_RANTA|nr:unnamed protein product [Rangifer tarandus platyrhynchus]